MNIENEITKVIKAGGLCSAAEYRTVLSAIQDGQNVLIFGTGKDSRLYELVNPTGENVFLENNYTYVKMGQDQGLNVFQVEYQTGGLPQMEQLPEPLLKILDLPKEVTTTHWHVIFIDAPVGKKYGRMAPIHLSKSLKWDRLFVHDYNRPCERYWVNLTYPAAKLKITDRLCEILK
jgi:hypothetical protein